MSLYVYDPTAHDSLSKVRGIGRYMQILQQSLPPDTRITADLSEIEDSDTLLNPYFDFIKTPLFFSHKTKKQIAVIHDIIRLRYPKHFPLGFKAKLFVKLNTIALRFYDSIITDSEHSKNTLIDFLKISSTKISVVYPVLSRVFLQSTKKDSNLRSSPLHQPYCLYVGDITWNKNLPTLAKAIKKTKLSCICVGKAFLDRSNLDHPEKKSFKEFLDLVDGDAHFIFPGFVSDDELINYYRHALCNVLVSYDEGFGFSYLEAAQCGTPSVLSDVSVFRETAQETALFGSPQEYEEIAKRITQLAKDPDLRDTLGQRAHKRAKWFSHRKFKNSLEAVLNS